MYTHTCAHYINKCSTLIPKEQRWKNKSCSTCI